MLRKCYKCDGRNEKSIDTTKGKYIYDTGKYYHYDCYLQKIIKKNKISKEDAIIEADRIFNLRIEIEKEKQIEDDFYQMIMKMYNLPLPNYFFMKVKKVVNGTYKKEMPQRITYKELTDMYSNKHMRLRLDKIAFSSKIKQDERFNWDLAVIFNEYPRYLKAKRRATKDSEGTKEAIENVKRYRINPSDRYKTTREETVSRNESSVDIDDIVNDILN